ncbi:MAG: GumC family protein [Blastocatellia bacterium]
MNFSFQENKNRQWLDQTHLLREIAQVLLARRWLIIGTTLLTFALTAVGTRMLKPVWSASATILLKKERFDAPVSPEQTIVTGQPDRHLTEEEINSEVEILRSRLLLEAVVQRLSLDREFQPPGKPSALKSLLGGETLTPQARALLKLQEDLSIDPVKKSNVIRVSCRAADRELAATIVNTLCAVYQEHHVSIRQNDGTQNFFEQQAQAMRERLAEREAALQRINPLPGTQLLSQQIETQIRQLNEFEVAWRTTRTALAESEARLKSIEQQLSREPEQLLSEKRTSWRLAPDTIKSQLFALELRRTELLGKYRPDHRLVREVEKELAQARQMVAQLEKASSESVSVSVLNPLRQRLTEALANERSNLASLREKERSLATTVAQVRERLRQLGAQGYEQRRLDRERELADNAYQSYAKKGEESRMSAALDRQGIINVQVVEPARAAFRPLSPNVPLNLALGLIGGLIAALAATFTLEYFNPTPQKVRPAVPIGRVVQTVPLAGSGTRGRHRDAPGSD